MGWLVGVVVVVLLGSVWWVAGASVSDDNGSSMGVSGMVSQVSVPPVGMVEVFAGVDLGGVVVDAHERVTVSWSVPADLGGVSGYEVRVAADPGGGLNPGVDDWFVVGVVSDPAVSSVIVDGFVGLEVGVSYLVEVSAVVEVSAGRSWVRAGSAVVLSEPVSVGLSGPAAGPVESDGKVVVSVGLSAPVSWDVGLSVSTVGSTAVVGSDFVGLDGVGVVVPAGEVSVSVEVVLVDDGVVEGLESFLVVVDAGSVDAGVVVGGGGGMVRVMVADDDVAMVSVSNGLSDRLVVEDVAVGGSAVTVGYEFALDSAVDADVTVDWRITGSGVSVADFTGAGLSGSVTIPAMSLSVSDAISLTITDDSVMEDEELVLLEIVSVSVSLQGASDRLVKSAGEGQALFRIAASDGGTPSDQVSNVRIVPGKFSGGEIVPDISRFEVWWDLPTDTSDVFSYEVAVAKVEDELSWIDTGGFWHVYADSPASRSSVYAGKPGRDIPTISAGSEYVGRVRIKDTDDEYRDWVYSVGQPARALGPLEVALVGEDVVVVDSLVLDEDREAGDPVEFEDLRSVDIPIVAYIPPRPPNDSGQNFGSGNSFSVDGTAYNIFLSFSSDHARSGTGIEGTHDYIIQTTRSGSKWYDVICYSCVVGLSFKILGNDTVDGDKVITVSLTGEVTPGNEDVRVDTSRTTRVIIIDDETATPVPADVGVVAGDGDGMNVEGALSVSWTAPTVPAGLEVTGYVVQYGLVEGGVVVWSEDVVVDGADSSGVVVVPDDGLVGGSYKARVRVRTTTRESLPVWAESASSVMVDSVLVGDPGLLSVSFSETALAASEGGGFGERCPVVEVVMSGVLRDPVRVGLTGVGGDDFVDGDVVGTIPAGSDSWSGRVCVVDDEVVEGSEVFEVGLSVVSGGVMVGESDSFQLTVTDDDRALVSLSSSALSVVEDVVSGGGVSNELSLEVGLSKVLSQDVDVGLVFSGNGISAGDLVSSDVTFSGLETSVRVPAGEGSVTVVVEIADDDIAEPSQMLSVELSGLEFPGGGFGEGVVSVDTENAVVEVLVAFSDGYVVGVSASLSGVQTVVEEDVDGGAESVVTYVVSLDSPVDVDVSVGFELVAVSASGSFFPADVVVSPSSPLVIVAGESSGMVEVRVVDDGFREGSERFQIRLVSVLGTPTDGTPVEIIQSLGPQVVIAASDPGSSMSEPDPVVQANPGGSQPSSGSGGSGGQTVPTTQLPAGGNGQSPSTSPPSGQGGQTVPPTQPPDTSGGNGQNQTPSTGIPTSPGGQPTGGSPTNPGVQPNTGGGGVPPGGVAGPSPTGDAASGTTFIDTIGNTHESNIGMLADLGITRGCNPPSNTRYCPDRAVTRGEMATFMVRAFDLSDTSDDLFGDDDGNTHEANINRLATAEITRGCNPPENSRYCPERPVTRAQMATFIARALDLAAGSGDFNDTAGSVHSNDINRIATVGITRGCNPPANSRYCPERPVTRAEMATFLIRATDLQGS